MNYKAIIDFGSCAVKVYIYECYDEVYKEIYVMRFKLDLSNLVIDGVIDEKNVFFIDWAHIMRVIKNYNIAKKDIHIYATAVLRTYSHANILCDFLYANYKIKINILNGAQEANIVALGVISSTYNVDGLVIDLGGGSIELAVVEDGHVALTRSYELSKTLLKNFDDIITEMGQVKNIYLVGGLLRVIMKRYMHKIDYPLKVLHNFSCRADDLLSYILFVLNNDLFMKNELLGYNILKGILSNTSATNVLVSNYGLKEGLRIKYLMQKDILTYEDNIKMIRQASIGQLGEEIVESYVNGILSVLNLDEDFIWRNLVEDYIGLITFKLSNFDLSINKQALADSILYTHAPYMHKYKVMLYFLINDTTLFRNGKESALNGVGNVLTKRDIIILQILSNMLSIVLSIQGTYRMPNNVVFQYQEGDMRFIFKGGKISSSIFRTNLRKIRHVSSKMSELMSK